MNIEPLEPRQLLSYTASYDSGTKILSVVGSASADSIFFTYHPTASYPNVEIYDTTSETDYIQYLIYGAINKISVQTNDGNDTVGISADTLAGTDASNFPFNLEVNAGKGNDTVSTGAGKDTLTGGEGNDSLSAGPGNDTVDGAGGTDQLAGGLGVDWCINASRVSPLSLSLDGVANDGYIGENDNIQSSIENISGGSGNDTITGNSAGNNLIGGPGNDLIRGLTGNDVLYGSAGRDTMQGGENDDLFYALEPGEVDSMNGGNGFDMASRDGAAVGDVFNQFAAKSSSGPSSSFGPSLGPVDDVVDSDVEIETNGPDLVVNTTTGNDSITLSQAGNNMTFTRNGVTIVRDITGVTRVAVAGDLGNDTIYASASVIVPLLLNGNGGNDSITGGTGADTIKGSTGNDTLSGGSGTDSIDGGDGADRLVGGNDNDSLYGLAGNDTLIGNAGNDLFDGGTEIDLADYSGNSSAVRVSLDGVANDGAASISETDNVGTSVENVTGGSGNDSLTGNSLANSLDGGAGADSILGNAGNDTLTGGSGGDFLGGGDNADIFNAFDGETDTIRGGNGADQGAIDDFDDAIF